MLPWLKREHNNSWTNDKMEYSKKEKRKWKKKKKEKKLKGKKERQVETCFNESKMETDNPKNIYTRIGMFKGWSTHF